MTNQWYLPCVSIKEMNPQSVRHRGILSRLVLADIMFMLLLGICYSSTPKIAIDAAGTGRTVAPYLVGANVIYTKEDERDWTNNCKVEVLKRSGMSNLRYPGGHVVSFWDWEWPYHNGYQNFWDPGYIASLTESMKNSLIEDNGGRLSLDRYLEICRETGAVPVIGINQFQGYRFNRNEDSIAKAVRLVNYVKEKIDGPRYYYLDNEAGHQPAQNNHIPADVYPKLIEGYSTAIKAADPRSKIVVNIMGANRVEGIIRDYGDHVDMIDHHWYYNNGTWGRFSLDEWRADTAMNGRVLDLDRFQNWIEQYDKQHIEIGLLEWNLGPAEGADGSTPGTELYQGLVQVDMLMTMIEGNVKMGSLWPLTWNRSSGGLGFRDLADGPADYVSPTFFIHRAFSKAAGGSILTTSNPGLDPGFRFLAVKSADQGFIDLYFLNKSTDSVDLEIELPLPIVETVVMTYTRGESDAVANVREQHQNPDNGVLRLSIEDTSFTHVRCRISNRSTRYEMYSDDFETMVDIRNIADSPYPVGSWHQQGLSGWSTEGSETLIDDSSVTVGDFNGVAGNELRIGWAYDEVVTLYCTPIPIHANQSYTFRGRWEVGLAIGSSNGFIPGIAEFSADDGSLVRRLTPDTMVFGNTINPVQADAGTFEVTLSAEELDSAGTAPGNLIGMFLHHNNGDSLYDGSTNLKSDLYYIDNVALECSGTVSILDKWMAFNRVDDAHADSDGDGVVNQIEYVYGGDPTSGDASIILPSTAIVKESGGNWLEFVHRRRIDHRVRGLIYNAESTITLDQGDWGSDAIEILGIENLDSEIELVTMRVNIDEQPNRFIRLIINQL